MPSEIIRRCHNCADAGTHVVPRESPGNPPKPTIIGVVDDVRATHAALQRPSVCLPVSATGFRITEFAARVSAAGALRASTADVASRPYFGKPSRYRAASFGSQASDAGEKSRSGR